MFLLRNAAAGRPLARRPPPIVAGAKATATTITAAAAAAAAGGLHTEGHARHCASRGRAAVPAPPDSTLCFRPSWGIRRCLTTTAQPRIAEKTPIAESDGTMRTETITVSARNHHPLSSAEEAAALRSAALDDLAKCAEDGDLVGAYHVASALRERHALVARSGARSAFVIHDAQVTQALTRAIGSTYVWEECIPCLNLILEMRSDLLGAPARAPPSRGEAGGYTMIPNVDSEAIVAVLDAIMGPRLASMPSRHLAGVTALQVLSDYNSLLDVGALRRRLIRAIGFASDIHRLKSLEKTKIMQTVGADDRFELALAYARCLKPQTALEVLAGCGRRSNAQEIEFRVAMCVALAETSQLPDARAQYEELASSSQTLWADDGRDPALAAFDPVLTPLHTALAMVYSSALCILPRLPFTNHLHSMASIHCSSVYRPGYPDSVLDLYSKTVAGLRGCGCGCGDGSAWRRRGIDRTLFMADCLLVAMAGAAQTGKGAAVLPSIGDLSARLRRSQEELVGALRRSRLANRKYNTSVSAIEAQTPLVASEPLRHFLWAAVLAHIHGGDAGHIVEDEVRHAVATVPGFVPSVADLEPALLALLPRSFWASKLKGNFSDNAAFAVSDRVLCSAELHKPRAYGRVLLEMARRASFGESTDHRLFPLSIWVLRSQGQQAQAAWFLGRAMRQPPVSIKPGSLALARTRSASFFENIFAAASTHRGLANEALSHLPALLASKNEPLVVTERIAVAILYCCARSRNLPVALDTVASVFGQTEAPPPPRIQELLMRVCFAAGQVARAMPIFHRLNYGASGTQTADSSFVHIVQYMGANRRSVAGAEDAFDAWIQIMDHRGMIARRLADKWSELGKRRSNNAFLPRGGTVAAALARVRMRREAPGSLSDMPFLRIWELKMVVELAVAYLRCGMAAQARAWEAWVLDAVGQRQFRLMPAHTATLARLQEAHLARGSWDGIRACLDSLVALDRAVPRAAPHPQLYLLNQRAVYVRLAECICDDAAAGRTARMVRDYLCGRHAGDVWDRIRLLVHSTPHT
ncbi:hypothetical protein H4S06_000776 [Coemansia sp. BCRC 34490]|nr:hypothetical protein H4S06_000776 [Coemansia sp. BCRC 34490]